MIGILYVPWVKSMILDFQTVLNTHSMDSYRSLRVLDVYVSSIFDALVYKSCTKLLSVAIRVLVRFMQVKKFMERICLNNKYLLVFI